MSNTLDQNKGRRFYLLFRDTWKHGSSYRSLIEGGGESEKAQICMTSFMNDPLGDVKKFAN